MSHQQGNHPSNLSSQRGSTRGAEDRRRFRISTLVAILAVIVGIPGAVVAVIELRSPSSATPSQTSLPSPMGREQRMVSKLVAGDYYPKLQQLIGAEPDSEQSLSSGYTLYQFDRPWEYIDLLVHEGNVISMSVNTKTVKFRATVNVGNTSVTLNGPSIDRQNLGTAASEAIDFCGTGGDSPEWFYESYSLSMTNDGASFALGWSSSPVSIRATAAATVNVPYAACSQPKCYGTTDGSKLNENTMTCLERTGVLRQINEISPSAVVVSEPPSSVEMTPELLTIVPSTLP